MKPTNTVFSTDSSLEIPEISKAKELLSKEYGSKRYIPNIHITYSIVPFPEYNFEKGKKDILEYISKQKPFKIKLTELSISSKSNFISLKVEGEELTKYHINLTNILNKYRDGYVREKDLERLNNGDFNDQKKQYLEEYGFTRVMDLYKPHITIGSCDMDVDIQEVENKLLEILEPVLNKEIEIDNIRGLFHTDSSVSQLEMKIIWEEKIEL